MRHLNKFNTITEYNTAEPTLSIPNLSLILENNSIGSVGDYNMVAVEYLQSDGNSWIDTNIPYDSTKLTYKIKCKFSMPSYVSSYDAIFGAYTSENDKCLRIIRGANDSKMWLYYNSKANGGIQATFSTANSNIKEITITSTSVSLTELGTTTNYTYSTYSGNNTTSKFYLFAQGIVNGSISCKSKSRIYYWKIYDNDVLIHYLVPVRIGSVGYLFDNVSKKLFANSGTGNFTLGPDIVPVEYLQSTGTQYINTGLMHATGYRYLIDIAVVTNDNNYRSIIGAATGGDNDKFYLSTVIGSPFSMYLNNKAVTPVSIDIYSRLQLSVVQSDTTTILYHNANILSSARCLNFNLPVMLMARNSSNPKMIGRYYAFKAWNENNILLQDLIPVRIGTVGYMYDKVSRQLFANAGTGSFVVGPDNPKIKLTRNK